MDISPIVTLVAVLAVAFGLMLSNRVRADIVALAVPLVLGLAGVIGLEDVFSGFSRSAVITIIGIFILAHGLQRTGVTATVGRVIAAAGKRIGGSDRAMVAAVMACGAMLSLFMNNIAAAAIALPATVEAVKRRRVAPSQVMMPLAFATALGGMATYLTTGNIVVGEMLISRGLPGYGLFDFAAVGAPLIAIGGAFMLLFGPRLLPRREAFEEIGSLSALQNTYALDERLHQLRIPAGSPLAGSTIAQCGIGARFGIAIMALHRNGDSLLAPAPGLRLHTGDVLMLIGRAERIEELLALGTLVRHEPAIVLSPADGDIGLYEITLAPRSNAAGRTLRSLRFREKFGANALAIWHGGRSVRTDLGAIALDYGDALLVQASDASIALVQNDGDFLVMQPPKAAAPARPERATAAVVIFIAALTCSALGWLPIAHCMMVGALGMVLAGCLSMDEAYRAVDWRAVFLVAGLLPVSTAMARTGAADDAAQLLVGGLAPYGALAVAAGLLLLTVVLTQFMSGQITGVVLAPIAISAAQALGSDPRAMAMFVAIGTSMTFITPIAHPVNVFVMGAGGYRAGDFPRVGLPLTLLLIVTALVVIPIIWKI